MKINLIVSTLALFLLSGCAALERSFVEEMERNSDSYLVAGRDFPVVGGDTGEAYRSRDEIAKRTPASMRSKAKMKEEISLKEELNQKVEQMDEQELAIYTQDIKYLPQDSDKLYYLSLANDERAAYIQTKKQEYFDDQGTAKDIVKQYSIRSSEIYLGMSKDEVMHLWGKPTKVQVAGNPKYQNELWYFNEDGSYKQVFFEAGKVNGWALDL
jgi:hypothetical protein